MATRERPADRGGRRAREALTRGRRDFREARVAAGLSYRTVAGAVGVAHSQVRRFEVGQTEDPSIEFIAACCAVVGLDLGLRAFPAGDSMRDRAHVALLDRLRVRIAPNLRWRVEVPLPIPGDLRAWDAEVAGVGWRVRIDAETAIADGQLLERRLALKARDSGPGHILLLVADTRANRRAIALLRPGLGDLLPLDTRPVLRALGAGLDPGAGGIVVI